MDKQIERVLNRYAEKKKAKQNFWYSLYELVGQYVLSRKQHFHSEGTEGEIQNATIFDDTAADALHKMSSSMIGALWPNAAKSFQLTPPREMVRKKQVSEENKEWYSFATETMAEIMDEPKAGLIVALDEYMIDQGAFGISGVGAYEYEDDPSVPIIFKAHDCKQIVIDEGLNGFVDTVYIEREVTVRQLVMEFGYENVSEVSRKAFNDGNESGKVKVLHCIEPRMERDPYSFGNADMPIASLHIEMGEKHKLKESGYIEMPIFVTRFWKAMGEMQGRSPAMNALPSILEANASREAVIRAGEKILDPPLGVMDDGVLGNGEIDTSAGAVNVFSISGRLQGSQKPIEPLYTVGDPSWVYNRLTELREIISNHFFIDRLLDLNNETKMTLGEANIRNKLRGESLGTIYARQIVELFSRLIDRVFWMLFRLGRLGVIKGSQEEEELLKKGIEPYYIPDGIAQRMMAGQDIYKIKYISPASRIMQVEELNGILQTVNMVNEMAPNMPDVLDILDEEETVRRVADLSGAPEEIVRSTEAIIKLREARAQQQQAMMEAEQQRTASETARNAAQAGVMMKEAA